jgi:hypothetical protein
MENQMETKKSCSAASSANRVGGGAPATVHTEQLTRAEQRQRLAEDLAALVVRYHRRRIAEDQRK